MSGDFKPGYKYTEIGVIPEDWRVEKVGDIATISSGGTPSRANPSYWGGDIPWVTTTQVDFNVIREAQQYITRDGMENSAAKMLPAGTLLMALYGQGKTRGKVAILGITATTNQACASISISDPVLARFTFNYLTSQYEAIRASSNGGSQDNLSGGIVKHLQIPVPPKLEQAKITSALSDIGTLISGLDQLIAKKYDILKAAMQQLLTGQRRLPGFSGEWEVKVLGELIELIPGGIYGSELKAESLVGIPVATTAHIDSSDQWNNKEMSIRYFTPGQVDRYTPIDGDLIVVKSSGSAASIQSGKVGFVDTGIAGTFIFSNFLMLLRPTSCVPKFLYYQLISGRIKKMLPQLVEASTYPNIRINDYLEISIPRPDVDEQVAIASVLSDMGSEIATLETRRNKALQLKQGMMQELLTGRIRLV
jgi:type I restriction enzyme S subunit